MANGFVRGFEKTFGPSLLQGQQQAGKLAIERKKIIREAEAGKKIASALKDVEGIPPELLEGLEDSTLTIGEFAKGITAQREALEAAAKAPTAEELALGKGQALPSAVAPILAEPSAISGIPSLRGSLIEAVQGGGLRETKRIVKTPSGLTTKTFEIEKTAAEKRAATIERGRGKGIEEAFKQAEGIKRAAKKLGSITRQFNEALPAKGRTALEQRVFGTLSLIGAKTGFKSNPKLFALQATAKLQLRAILRDMGEGARLSDQDITQNIAVIEQAGLTFEERQSLVQSFLQTAVDSMDDATLDVLREDPSSVELMSEFGVRLFEDDFTQSLEQEVPQFNSVEEANSANLPVGTSIMVVNPNTGKLQKAVIE